MPVSEAIRYRKCAQLAERQLEEARDEIERLQKELNLVRNNNRVEALLREADAIDMGAAKLLTEAALYAMDEPDVVQAVEDLKRHKPYLFKPNPDRHTEGDLTDLQQASDIAKQSGDRRDLLRYLRLKRRP